MQPPPASSGSLTPPSDGLPERIGAYRVLRRLATGGTSDVLLARAEGPHGFERPVVLKLLLQQFRDDEKFERMFAREAAAYGRLSHPAIVKLYDFFADAGQLVMVLEYVDGLPLHKARALLRSRGRALDDAASIFVASRVFGALAAAHSASDPQTGDYAPVIHRDVNPSNVLLPWDGHAKIADFGIAKLAGVEGETGAGLIKGTYGYMAPEQVRGEPVTIRADVYAACLLLWELLSGRKAIVRDGRGSDLDVLRAMAQPSFPSLASLRPELPTALVEAIGRGLEPDPNQRAIFADELCDVLRASADLEAGRQALVDVLASVRPPQESEEERGAPLRPLADSSADDTLEIDKTIADAPRTPAPVATSAVPPQRPRAPVPPRPVAIQGATPPPAPAAKAGTPVAKIQPVTVRLPKPTPPPAPAPPPVAAAPPPARLPSPTPAAPVQAAPLPPPAPLTPPPSPAASPAPAAPTPGAAVVAAALTAVPWAPPAAAPAAPRPPVWTPPPPIASLPGTPSALSAMEARATAGTSWRAVLFAIVALSACGGAAGAFFWLRHAGVASGSTSTSTSTSTPTSTPTPTPTSTPTSTPTPTPTPTSAPEPAPASTAGQVTVPRSRAGHRIWIDGRMVGQSPGSFPTKCGWRRVRVGSQAHEKNVNVPCGGEIEVR